MRKVILSVLSFVFAFTIAVPASGQIVINEILADPATGAAGDANGDGTRDFADDEFVEIYNNGSSAVDLSGYTIDDETGLRHTIPSGTTLDAGEGLTVFGGGTPTGIPGVVQTASSGALGLNNGGDTVTLSDGSGGTVDSHNYGSEGGDDQSLVRSPEFTGAFVQHTTVSTDAFSPGRQVDGTPLPVELATFTAQVSGTQAQLQWETLSETNNAGFDIQHKAPGASSFRTLGFVEGHGTTDTPQSYRFSTDALDAGTHTFRLRQIDLDGTDALHEPITVEVNQGNLMRLTGPNPVQSGMATELTIQPEQSGDMTVALYNVLGQRVETLHSGRVSADDVLRLTLDTDRLSSGMYFVRANGDSVRQTERITVVR